MIIFDIHDHVDSLRRDNEKASLEKEVSDFRSRFGCFVLIIAIALSLLTIMIADLRIRVRKLETNQRTSTDGISSRAP